MHPHVMSKWHQLVLALSCVVILTELFSLVIFHREIFDWVSHNLWVVIIPFAKVIVKRLIAMKLVVAMKAFLILMWHLSKLVLLKLFKSLSVRYGVFFTQIRWYWARRAKVMFLRRGKQFFRASSRFWAVFTRAQKWLILVAFFPIILLLFLLGLSFNVTRKTMVQKTQETAVFQTVTVASNTSRGVRSWMSRLDRWALAKIKELTPKGRN